MASHSSWHPLPVPRTDLPVLLVSTSFANASYDIRVTDLAHVWAETLDRRLICKRGFDEDTTIDPSEHSQMDVFLGKLASAFDISSADHHDASLTLSSGAPKSPDDLLVRVTCILPAPLKPLEWPMYLKKCPPSSIATELVIPLIQAHHARLQETTALISALGEKDGVITRLVDKLEAMGTGLEHVFTALSGRKKATRAAAEGRVKGLTAFSEANFRAEADSLGAGEGTQGVMALVQETFRGGLSHRSDLELADSPGLDDWWTRLSTTDVALVDRHKEAAPSIKPPSQAPKSPDDDDFQVQEVPPHSKSARKGNHGTKHAEPSDDESTDGDDSHDIQPQPAPSPVSKQTTSSTTSRLGTIAKRAPDPPANTTPPEPEDSTMQDSGSETASDADDAPEPLPLPPPRRTGGLGRIGGKAKAPTPEPPLSSSPAKTPAKSLQRKLGVIGKKPAATESPHEGEESRGRANDKPDAIDEKPRETSAEAADRKRQELQKKLETKAAGPARKKRKF